MLQGRSEARRPSRHGLDRSKRLLGRRLALASPEGIGWHVGPGCSRGTLESILDKRERMLYSYGNPTCEATVNEYADTKWYQYQRTAGTTLAGPWLLAWMVSTIALGYLDASSPLRVVVALLPLPFFGWFLWRFLQLIRKADELESRIQLEALAIAFPLSIATVMVFGLLERAGLQPVSGWPLKGLWIYFVVFYLVGRNVARRRYA